MNRALVLGGTGLVGRAIALRLARGGWRVDVTGRDFANMPNELIAADVSFVRADSRDASARSPRRSAPARTCSSTASATPPRTLGGCCRSLATRPSTVMISSKAVYVDARATTRTPTSRRASTGRSARRNRRLRRTTSTTTRARATARTRSRPSRCYSTADCRSRCCGRRRSTGVARPGRASGCSSSACSTADRQSSSRIGARVLTTRPRRRTSRLSSRSSRRTRERVC